jgi:hypothetical protein
MRGGRAKGAGTSGVVGRKSRGNHWRSRMRGGRAKAPEVCRAVGRCLVRSRGATYGPLLRRSANGESGGTGRPQYIPRRARPAFEGLRARDRAPFLRLARAWLPSRSAPTPRRCWEPAKRPPKSGAVRRAGIADRDGRAQRLTGRVGRRRTGWGMGPNPFPSGFAGQVGERGPNPFPSGKWPQPPL